MPTILLFSVVKNFDQLSILERWCSRSVLLNPLKIQFFIFKRPNSKKSHPNFPTRQCKFPRSQTYSADGNGLSVSTILLYIQLVLWYTTLYWQDARANQSSWGLVWTNWTMQPKHFNSHPQLFYPLRFRLPYGVLPSHLTYKFTTLEIRILRPCQYLPFRFPRGEVFANISSTSILTRFQT